MLNTKIVWILCTLYHKNKTNKVLNVFHFNLQCLRKFFQNQKQPLDVLYKKSVLKIFVKLRRKQLQWSIFYNKVAGDACKLNKETPVQVFSCEFCETFKGPFFTERLRMTAAVKCLHNMSWEIASVRINGS